jgi:hypothetical protein
MSDNKDSRERVKEEIDEVFKSKGTLLYIGTLPNTSRIDESLFGLTCSGEYVDSDAMTDSIISTLQASLNVKVAAFQLILINAVLSYLVGMGYLDEDLGRRILEEWDKSTMSKLNANDNDK